MAAIFLNDIFKYVRKPVYFDEGLLLLISRVKGER